MSTDGVTRTFIFTVTYQLEGEQNERIVQVSATRSGTNVELRVTVAGFSPKNKKLRPHKRMPADSTLMSEAMKIAKSTLPRGVSDLKGKGKRG